MSRRWLGGLGGGGDGRCIGAFIPLPPRRPRPPSPSPATKALLVLSSSSSSTHCPLHGPLSLALRGELSARATPSRIVPSAVSLHATGAKPERGEPCGREDLEQLPLERADALQGLDAEKALPRKVKRSGGGRRSKSR